jgi:Kef-type K+ transport system membrane component KefB
MFIVAVLSKLLGGGLGARLAGFTNREAAQLGAGLISRGEVGLIVASVGITEGLIGGDIFSVVVGVVILTTLLTPLVLRSLFSVRPAAQGERS